MYTSYTYGIIVGILIIGLIFYNMYYMPHYTPRTISTLTSINNVPLKIYQSWHSRHVPPYMKQNIQAIIQANPEFEYYLYSDYDSRSFIQANYNYDVVKAFDSLKPGAYKSDLWRYCILYKLGGVYFDIKMVPLVPLTQVLSHNSVIFVKDIEINHTTECVWNGLMISPPNNPVFKYCIDEIVESCKARSYKRNPLDITGPCLLGRMIKTHTPTNFFTNTILNLYKDSRTGNMIMYHNIPYFRVEYPEYRTEQKKFQKSLYYDTLYKQRNVYE